MSSTRITRKDIDDLVEIADKDPEFKKYLQDLDMLARKRNLELKDLIQRAVDRFYKLESVLKKENRNKWDV